MTKVGWRLLVVALGGAAALSASCASRSLRPAGCTAGVLVLGACVESKLADRYCGKAAHWGVGGCEANPCAVAQVIDVETGACLSSWELAGLDRAVASDETLRCDDDRPPVVDRGKTVCLPIAARCPRGTKPVGGQCERTLRCGPGEVGTKSCQRVATSTGLDVTAWLEAVGGRDGDLCGVLALRVGALGLDEVRLKIAITLVFPNHDVSQGFARLTVQGVPSTPQGTAVLVEESFGTLFDLLRAYGGETRAPVASIQVVCDLRTAGRAHAERQRDGG
ncbi:MAG: hypothetical protein WCI05_05520 [Myxococcales bacterium]